MPLEHLPCASTELENRHVRLAPVGTAKRAETEPETSAWLQAHRALSQLAKERANADAEEGRWLLAALRSAAHLHLGFASFSEYIERSFGYKPRTTQEKLRVAEALEELPALTQALEQGSVHWSAVRELTRVAVPESEAAWLAVAHGKSVRQLEELVAGKTLGDDPSSPQRISERRHVLRFEVAPETFALFREALTALRRSTDAALDDDAALLALARLALGGPRDEGRASYQIAITLCPNCGQGHQPANGELVPIGREIIEMAHCDAQHLGRVSPQPANDSTPEPTPHRTNDAHVSAAVPFEHEPVHAPKTSSLRASGRVVHAHAHAHVAAKPSRAPDPDPVLARAKQPTPPALRRAILARDHRRCRVPGCRNTAFVDVHHLHLRSEGGPHRSENLVTLCGAHHRAAHRGQLVVDGTATEARFRHADGSSYGRVIDPQALEARAKAFRALRGLGFREGDVNAALAQLEHEGGLVAAPAEQWLRAALARLTPSRSRR
jgi:hypothetical protein